MMELLSNIKQLEILDSLEGNSMLFIAGHKGLSTKDEIMAFSNFYALLTVYVSCFCTPLFSFVLSGLSGFRNGIRVEFSGGVDSAHIASAFFVEDKECIYKLSFLQKRWVEYNLLRDLLSKNRVATA